MANKSSAWCVPSRLTAALLVFLMGKCLPCTRAKPGPPCATPPCTCSGEQPFHHQNALHRIRNRGYQEGMLADMRGMQGMPGSQPARTIARQGKAHARGVGLLVNVADLPRIVREIKELVVLGRIKRDVPVGPCGEKRPFSAFPSVCPEPVLVNRSLLCINGSERRFPHRSEIQRRACRRPWSGRPSCAHSRRRRTTWTRKTK